MKKPVPYVQNGIGMSEFLIDTNLLIYHTAGVAECVSFIEKAIREDSFNISIITEIEFLGWDRHTEEGFEKCKQLIELAHIVPLDESVATKAVELRRKSSIKLADAVIAATALVYSLKLATRNKEDFRSIEELEIYDPFDA